MTQPTSKSFTLRATGSLAALLCALSMQTARADDEIRAGAVVQIPFNLNGRGALFDPGAIRLGVTCQWADVEEDEITGIREITINTENGVLVDRSETTRRVVDEGNQVYGVEGDLFVTLFGDWNLSGELLGFYGTNDIQGAFGAGYGGAQGFFFDVKAMFPYAEVGLQFLGGAELYGGLKTLGSFDPAQSSQRFTMTTTNERTSSTTSTTTVVRE